MALWSARNGFLGYGPVAALVEAETEAEALEAGRAALAAYDDRPEFGEVTSIERVTLPYVGDVLP